MKIAVVDKAPSKSRYEEFNFDYDLYHLTDERTGKKKRLLKADVKLDMTELDPYDLVILVGAEPSKHIAKITQITKYTGHLIDNKFVPMINPVMAKFKPEVEPVITDSLQRINDYISGNVSSKEGDYRGITCADEAKEYLRKVLRMTECKAVAVDTETTALYPKDGYVLGISVSHKAYQGVYISSDCIDTELEQLFQELFNTKLIVFHHAKFDRKFLEYHFDFEFKRWVCTMTMHYILNENEAHDLKFLCMKYTDMGDYERDLDQWKREFCRRNKIKLGDFTYDLIPFEILSEYACKDADGTLRLYHKFSSIVDRSVGFSKLYYNFLIPAVDFLKDIENIGVPFSKKKLKTIQKSITEEIIDLKKNIYKYDAIHEVEKKNNVVFNPNSTAHLRHLFFNELGLPVTKKTPTGAPSTDAEVLEFLAQKHEVADYVLKIRKLQKIKSTYIDKILLNLDSDLRLRTGFNLTITTSGRLSSSGKLNMQQLPRDDKRVKSCISMEEIDPNYVIWSQDLQTAEMYYAAVLSNDENLMDVFRKGGDFHSTIAHTVFNIPCAVEEVSTKYPQLRQAAKAVSFGILYGAGPGKVAATANISFEEAKDVIAQYFARFNKLRIWLNNTQTEIATNGFIYSVFNRKRRVPNVFSVSEEERGHAIRSALNFTVQSVASDVNLMAAIDINKFFKRGGARAEVFALVHDSILGVSHRDDIQLVQDKVKYFTQLDRGVSIPNYPIGVDFGYGESYAEAG